LRELDEDEEAFKREIDQAYDETYLSSPALQDSEEEESEDSAPVGRRGKKNDKLGLCSSSGLPTAKKHDPLEDEDDESPRRTRYSLRRRGGQVSTPTKDKPLSKREQKQKRKMKKKGFIEEEEHYNCGYNTFVETSNRKRMIDDEDHSEDEDRFSGEMGLTQNDGAGAQNMTKWMNRQRSQLEHD